MSLGILVLLVWFSLVLLGDISFLWGLWVFCGLLYSLSCYHGPASVHLPLPQVSGKLPFTTVYLHAMVRENHGSKMSKSTGENDRSSGGTNIT